MKSLFHVDAVHRADIGSVGAVSQSLLVHDGGPVDQPLDHGDVRPGRSRVVEAVVVLRLSHDEISKHVVTTLAEFL